jgi:hypothetical protein
LSLRWMPVTANSLQTTRSESLSVFSRAARASIAAAALASSAALSAGTM